MKLFIIFTIYIIKKYNLKKFYIIKLLLYLQFYILTSI